MTVKRGPPLRSTLCSIPSRKRIREEYVHTGDTEASMIHGIATKARSIASAALIMVSVFTGFLLALPEPARAGDVVAARVAGPLVPGVGVWARPRLSPAALG